MHIAYSTEFTVTAAHPSAVQIFLNTTPLKKLVRRDYRALYRILIRLEKQERFAKHGIYQLTFTSPNDPVYVRHIG